ncbi:MAG: EF-hand domain-containing protein [Pseudomonadota bacterium]
MKFTIPSYRLTACFFGSNSHCVGTNGSALLLSSGKRAQRTPVKPERGVSTTMNRAATFRILPALATVAVSLSVQARAPQQVTAADETNETMAAHAQVINPFFVDLDCENLGYVQPGEVDEHLGPIFMGLDLDGSSEIDPAEWRSHPAMRDQPLLAISFSVADVDHDGGVNYLELLEYLKTAINALDDNGDGELSPMELDAFLPAD